VAGAPSLTITDLGVTATITITVVLLASFVPALRAARTSTITALADTARMPRRRGWLIVVSRRLPIALLLGLRITARRPRRLILTATSVAITTATIVAVVAIYARNQPTPTGYTALDDPRIDAIHQVLLVLTAVLVLLAATNTMFVTWATIADTRHAVALNRALGATIRQVNAGLLASLLLPATVGSLLGLPAGIGLLRSVDHNGTLSTPPALQLILIVLANVLALAGLASVPARVGARRPIAPILQSDTTD
jgi:putative ABC transport system permease protein